MTMKTEAVQAKLEFVIVERDEAERVCSMRTVTMTVMQSEFGRSLEDLATLAVDSLNGEGGK
jgi:hypothetical protein